MDQINRPPPQRPPGPHLPPTKPPTHPPLPETAIGYSYDNYSTPYNLPIFNRHSNPIAPHHGYTASTSTSSSTGKELNKNSIFSLDTLA